MDELPEGSVQQMFHFLRRTTDRLFSGRSLIAHCNRLMVGKTSFD